MRISHTHWARRPRFASLWLLISLWLAGPVITLAEEDQESFPTPPIVEYFISSIPAQVTGQQFLAHVDRHVWQLYSDAATTKVQLVAYLRTGQDPRGLAFAALSLVQFHDPKDIDAIARRALDWKTSTFSRWYMLNAMPYILSMGDV